MDNNRTSGEAQIQLTADHLEVPQKVMTKKILSQRKLTKLGGTTSMNHHQPDISIYASISHETKNL